MHSTLLTLSPEGLYCPQGRFYIDPWRAVPHAVVTHAHSDHARGGCEHYLIARPGERVFRCRLGEHVNASTLDYGETIIRNGVTVSFHPAGHVLGSAQVRLEYQGEVLVVSGDYKVVPDGTCEPFEPVSCHTFITESTFGVPIYRWQEPRIIFDEINRWWRSNRDSGKASIIYAYSLGKAQRILANIDPTIGPIITHGAIEPMNRAYRESGVALPVTRLVSEFDRKHSFAGAFVIAPPSAQNSPWTRRFEPASEAVASGWMTVRGVKRRRSVDRGFVLSDHADWPGLNAAIKATQARRIFATHGSTQLFTRWLREQGYDADVVATHYSGDGEEPSAEGEAIVA